MTNRSKALTREDIFGANDLKTERVEVPEWGGHVNVRMMNGLERVAFEESLPDQEGEMTSAESLAMFNRLLVRTVVNDDGEQVFNSNGDVDKLGEKSPDVILVLSSKAGDLNGFKAGAAEETAKNLPETDVSASE